MVQSKMLKHDNKEGVKIPLRGCHSCVMHMSAPTCYLLLSRDTMLNVIIITYNRGCFIDEDSICLNTSLVNSDDAKRLRQQHLNVFFILLFKKIIIPNVQYLHNLKEEREDATLYFYVIGSEKNIQLVGIMYVDCIYTAH